MGAFLSGLGFEGSDTFLSTLQGEPLLAAGTTPITQVFVTLTEDKWPWTRNLLVVWWYWGHNSFDSWKYIALYLSLQTLLSLTSFGFLLQDLVSFSVKDGKRHLRINQGFSYFKANHSKLKENIIIHMCIHTYILKGLLSSRNSQMKTLTVVVNSILTILTFFGTQASMMPGQGFSSVTSAVCCESLHRSWRSLKKH